YREVGIDRLPQPTTVLPGGVRALSSLPAPPPGEGGADPAQRTPGRERAASARLKRVSFGSSCQATRGPEGVDLPGHTGALRPPRKRQGSRSWSPREHARIVPGGRRGRPALGRGGCARGRGGTSR